MGDFRKRLIPGWTWGGVALLAVALVVALSATDRRRTPGAAFEYDVSSYAPVAANDVRFVEIGSIALDIPEPSALAVGPGGRTWVAGQGVVASFDVSGKASARFAVEARPECIAFTPDGRLLAGMRHGVTVYDAEGKPAASWQDLGERSFVTSIAVDDENVFVADAGNRVVLRFDYAGTLLGRIGERDEVRQVPGLVVPSAYLDVAVDPQGALWVVNPGKHGLEDYRPNGDLVSAWYRASMDIEGFCGCCNPTHIAFRGDGAVVTAEKGLNRVKLYAPDTKFLGVIAPPNVFLGPETAPMASVDEEPPILDLGVDGQGRVLVLDKRKNAVRVFEEIPRRQRISG